MWHRINRLAFWSNELGGVLLGAGALLAVVLLWDWNWLRPLVERQASQALGRAVRLERIEVHGWRTPTLVLVGIRLDNPPGFPRDSGFGRVQRLAVTFDPLALFDRRLALTAIHVEQPQFALYAPPDAAANWVFPGRDPQPPEDEPLFRLDVGRLSIAGGRLRFEHPQFKSDFQAIVETGTGPGSDAGDAALHVRAAGRYAGQPLRATFVGGALLSLRDATNPYPVKLEVSNGPTQLRLQGTLLDPLRLGGADLALRFEGPDLSALYPLTGLPLPPTAPYRLEGRLDYVDDAGGARVRFRDFSGRIGSSDIGGDLAVRLGGVRPRVEADLRSGQVLMADLAGFVGAPPGAEDASGQTAEQKQERATQQARPRVLPDTPINLPKLRGADFDVRYAADRIQGRDTPFDNLQAHLRIDDGVVSLRPIRVGTGMGDIAAHLLLDGTRDRARVQADVEFRDVDAARLLAPLRYRGQGRIDGRAALRGRGNSVAALLAGGDGQLRLSMAGGDVSALLINLAGLDFGNALLSALGIPSRAELRCMVADLDLKKGLVRTDTLLMDTTEAQMIGSGTVNLADESIDYRVRTEPKTFNIGSVAAPINIGGTLKSPRVRPDAKALGVRGGAAAALGIIGTPLAALAATIQPGTGKDADCAALIRAVRREAARLPRTPEAAHTVTPPLRPAP